MKITILKEELHEFPELRPIYTEAVVPPIKAYCNEDPNQICEQHFERIDYHLVTISAYDKNEKEYYYMTGIIHNIWKQIHSENERYYFKIKELKANLHEYRTMTFWQRLKFLFKI